MSISVNSQQASLPARPCSGADARLSVYRSNNSWLEASLPMYLHRKATSQNKANLQSFNQADNIASARGTLSPLDEVFALGTSGSEPSAMFPIQTAPTPSSYVIIALPWQPTPEETSLAVHDVHLLFRNFLREGRWHRLVEASSYFQVVSRGYDIRT